MRRPVQQRPPERDKVNSERNRPARLGLFAACISLIGTYEFHGTSQRTLFA